MILRAKTKLFFRATILLVALVTTTLPQLAHAQGVKVVVIDPGHGGSFPGAQYGGHLEKDINLRVALKVGDLMQKRHPDIKIVFTRTKDVALASTLSADLSRRSQIANDANGDLFVSIHANAASSTAAYGAETLIMGESSLEKQRNDAALYTANKEHLIDMSNEKTAAIVRAYIQNLQFTYGQYSEALARLIQKNYGNYDRKLREIRRQPIMVLYRTDMPCVLTEIGFMTNAKELAYMTSTKGVSEIAESIYGGIKEYIEMVNKTSKSTPQKSNDSQLKSGYTIQILSSIKRVSLNDRQFKSYKERVWERVTEDKYKYKYYVGKYRTRDEAADDLSAVRRTFKDAYIVAFKN